METIINQSPSRQRGEHIQVKAVVLPCIDPGFRGLLKELLRKLGFRSSEMDLFGWAGGAKGIADKDISLLNQIAASVKMHHAPEVVLMVHADCGGYGHPKFASEEAEQNFYVQQLQSAKTTLETFLGGQGLNPTISGYYFHFEAVVKVF